MPPLVACGRRWEVGSDDLVFPGFVLVVVRSIWLLLQVRWISDYNTLSIDFSIYALSHDTYYIYAFFLVCGCTETQSQLFNDLLSPILNLYAIHQYYLLKEFDLTSMNDCLYGVKSLIIYIILVHQLLRPKH